MQRRATLVRLALQAAAAGTETWLKLSRSPLAALGLAMGQDPNPGDYSMDFRLVVTLQRVTCCLQAAVFSGRWRQPCRWGVFCAVLFLKNML